MAGRCCSSRILKRVGHLRTKAANRFNDKCQGYRHRNTPTHRWARSLQPGRTHEVSTAYRVIRNSPSHLPNTTFGTHSPIVNGIPCVRCLR